MSRLSSSGLTADSLRWALLVALGLPSFVACGGSTEGEGSGSGGSATGGSGTGGSSTGGSATAACENSSPLLEGSDTGFERCEGGFLHRPEVKVCPSSLPRSTVLEPVNPDPGDGEDGGTGGLYDECTQDSDCSGEHTYCASIGGSFQEGPAYLRCFEGCTQDADCLDGQLCFCGDPVGTCVEATCTADTDCSGDLLCVGTSNSNGCGTRTAFACQAPADECLVNADCAALMTCRSGGDHRVCEAMVVCGRPFLVDSSERRAALTPRADWWGALALDRLCSPAVQREMLAAHWAEVALMEHASIAAFARFSLQLLSLGAPATLLEQTHEALVDETRHARQCFALAGHYAGMSVGPGRLSLTDAFADDSVETILQTAILEGCVGETQAALEAARAAELCQEPVVREVLAAIARDEGCHAELAWRFVAWFLGERPELTELARATLATAQRNACVSGATHPEQQDSPDLRSFGVLGAEERRGVRDDAWQKVIEPCARGLFARARQGKRESVSEGVVPS